MNQKKRLFFAVLWTVLGAGLLLFGSMGQIDPYWSWMGISLIGVGIVRISQYIRYRKDTAYREKRDVEEKDERNRFLAGRAWALAGYLYVLLSGIGVIGFKLAGRDELSTWAACSGCAVMVLYWLSYLMMKKKY